MNLRMCGISKSFGSNLVLDKVDFSLEAGSIKALLGENGAGKSTLMNILGGVLEADEGKILLDKTPYSVSFVCGDYCICLKTCNFADLKI